MQPRIFVTIKFVNHPIYLILTIDEMLYINANISLSGTLFFDRVLI